MRKKIVLCFLFKLGKLFTIKKAHNHSTENGVGFNKFCIVISAVLIASTTVVLCCSGFFFIYFKAYLSINGFDQNGSPYS